VEGLGQRDELRQLRVDVQNAAANLDFVLVQYGSLLDPNQAYRLTNLSEEAKSALRSGDTAVLRQKWDEIGKAWAALPPDVLNCMVVRQAIVARLQPVDPPAAAMLLSEFDSIEAELRARLPSVVNRFNAFVDKAMAAIKKAEEILRPRVLCSQGHDVPPGERYCPVCKEDTFLLGAKPAVASSSGSLRSL
jgi:hypothetical protein